MNWVDLAIIAVSGLLAFMRMERHIFAYRDIATRPEAYTPPGDGWLSERSQRHASCIAESAFATHPTRPRKP